MDDSRKPRAGRGGLALAFAMGAVIAAPAIGWAKLQCSDGSDDHQLLGLELVSARRGGVEVPIALEDWQVAVLANARYSSGDPGDGFIQSLEADDGDPPSFTEMHRPLRRIP